MQSRHYIVIVALAWTLLVVVPSATFIRGDYLDTLRIAQVTARAAFEKDVAYRLWNAMSGGVYVAVTETNQPNPYLDLPDRDVRTSTGKILTLVNPAYMSRQANELLRKNKGIQGHITSLNPIRPGNAPDAWERVALRELESGVEEIFSRDVIDGEDYLRFMRPVRTEKACLRCHAKQGYQEGEIRGGISVSVPFREPLAAFRLRAVKIIFPHSIIWVLGLAGIIGGGRRLARSLREAQEARVAAEAANLSKSEFLANMSHEVRTPLNGVLGMLQLLRDKLDPQEQARYVELAYDSGRRLLGLLNDILDFSRMEAGGLALRLEPFSLRETFDSVANLFQTASAGKHLELVFHADESVPRLLAGDEARLRQILFNLVGNAVKFTLAGAVHVEAWARPSASHPGKVHLYLEIADTGVGIPGDKLDHIFDRFTQVDGSHGRRFEGAGLGLAIVRRIVELMEGGIDVDSEEGVGTTFFVHLLLSVPPDMPETPKQDRPLSGTAVGEPLRILLVEDETVSMLAVKVLLTRQGHAVTAAEDGRAALVALQQQRFDCVLMDIQMPVMNGEEATRALRTLEQQQGLPRTRVIALTAYAMPGDRERFLAAGLDDHVVKPVQAEELAQALSRVRPVGQG